MSGFDSFCVIAAAAAAVVIVVVVVVVVFASSYFCFVTISETQKECLREKGGRERELEGVASRGIKGEEMIKIRNETN